MPKLPAINIHKDIPWIPPKFLAFSVQEVFLAG